MKAMHELVAEIVAARAASGGMTPEDLHGFAEGAYAALLDIRAREEARMAAPPRPTGDAVADLTADVAREVAALGVSKRSAAWPAELRMLAELAMGARGDYVVEIGCFQGSSTTWLAAVCRRVGKRLIAIDPWEGASSVWEEAYATFCRNTASYADVLQVLRSTSDAALVLLPAACQANCALVFVDGLHAYPQVLLDIRNYWPLLAPGGVMAVHDVFEPNYWQAINRGIAEFRTAGVINYLKYIPTREEAQAYNHGVSGLAWFRKE